MQTDAARYRDLGDKGTQDEESQPPVWRLIYDQFLMFLPFKYKGKGRSLWTNYNKIKTTQVKDFAWAYFMIGF